MGLWKSMAGMSGLLQSECPWSSLQRQFVSGWLMSSVASAPFSVTT
ncbi:MAG: hypothetical protein M5U28_46815 [Sandaracinaceae bacterium]|nr:hypothetical protein [Sandaracinaceae bacterium]